MLIFGEGYMAFDLFSLLVPEALRASKQEASEISA